MAQFLQLRPQWQPVTPVTVAFSGFLVQQGALQIFHLAGSGMGEQWSLRSQSSAE